MTTARQVPPVEALRPGLWSLPVPIPDNPLGYTLVYLFETDKGPVLVDAGWDDEVSWLALTAGVARTGHEMGDVYGVLVTHMHPDHHGLSGRVQASGAWVAMHPRDASVLERRHEIEDEWLLQTAAVLLDSGAPEHEIDLLPPPELMARPAELVMPDRHLEDGELADVPGRQVRAIWTPGHSPGHTCFRMEGEDILLSGDTVLPEITPHIGLYLVEDEEYDPLGDFMRSLLRLASSPVTEVLPAHEHRFHSLPRRVGELMDHHQAHLAAIEGQLLARPRTSWEIAEAMVWNRPWEDLGIIMKRTALSEAYAHVRYLERQGRVERTDDTKPITWQLTRSRQAALEAAS